MRLWLTDVFRQALRAEIARQVRERALRAESTGGERVPDFMVKKLIEEMVSRGH